MGDGRTGQTMREGRDSGHLVMIFFPPGWVSMDEVLIILMIITLGLVLKLIPDPDSDDI